MDFRLQGLPRAPFASLFDLSDEELRSYGAVRRVADEGSVFPCRVSLQNASPGEEVILINHAHMGDPLTPYRSIGPIFIRRAARETWDRINEVPPSYLKRLMSIRAYNAQNMLEEARVVYGHELPSLISELLARPEIAYLHGHMAAHGCYHFRIDRA